MSKSNTFKPGENPPRPGEYLERGPRGGSIPKPRQVTIEPGDKPSHQHNNQVAPGKELANKE